MVKGLSQTDGGNVSNNVITILPAALSVIGSR